jgi:hypothetical protein
MKRIDALRDIGCHPTRIQETYWKLVHAEKKYEDIISSSLRKIENSIKSLGSVKTTLNTIELYMKQEDIVPDELQNIYE